MYTQVYTDTRTHRCTQIHTDVYTHRCTHTQRYTYAQRSERYMHTQMYTHRYTYRCTYREIHAHRCTHTEIHTHRCVHTYTYAQGSEIHTHRCTHIDRHTDYTQRYTHTQMYTQRYTQRRAHTDESGQCLSLPRPHPLRLSCHCLLCVFPSSGSFLVVCVSPRCRSTRWGLVAHAVTVFLARARPACRSVRPAEGQALFFPRVRTGA